MKKAYASIDLSKFFFSIVVVSIHAKPFADISENFTWYYDSIIANCAVPFFFMASGYLLFGKLDAKNDDEQNNIIKKHICHIFRMYLVWSILWLPWKILNSTQIGDSVPEFAGKWIWNFILGNTGDALWYLPGLITSVLIVWFVRKKCKSKITHVLLCGGGIFLESC